MLMELIFLIGIGWLVFSLMNRESSKQSPPREKSREISQQPQSVSQKPTSFKTSGRLKNLNESKEKIIARALEAKKRLVFRYIDQDGQITQRTVTPISLERRHEGQVLCLTAWCHLRDDRRTFVVHRIQNIRMEGL